VVGQGPYFERCTLRDYSSGGIDDLVRKYKEGSDPKKYRRLQLRKAFLNLGVPHTNRTDPKFPRRPEHLVSFKLKISS